MIITRTPFRISFVGGGSDLESYYQHSPGKVLSTTINKYMYISSHDYFDYDKIRIKYSSTETVGKVSDIEHPVVREVLTDYGIHGALEITSTADIPAKCGLGSSSAFTVGLLHNLETKRGRFVRKSVLGERACDIELGRLGGAGGKQDQYACAFGGLNILTFHPDGSVEVEPLHLRKSIYDQLQRNLLMFYTGVRRESGTVLEDQRQGIEANRKIVDEMVGLVQQMREALQYGEITGVGEILDQSWRLKQQLSTRIAPTPFVEIYEKARKHGALGGKILGAGAGGFFLFYCEPEHQDRLKAAMSPMAPLDFRFERAGSKVVFTDGD